MTLRGKRRSPSTRKIGPVGSKLGRSQESSSVEQGGARSPRAFPAWLLVAGVAAVVLAVAIFGNRLMATRPVTAEFKTSMNATPQPVLAPDPKLATYIGGETCSQCHAGEAKEWASSHHARAMQHAT